MVKELNREKGKHYEDVAINYLKKNKYKILERNFISPIGEIDIIAKVYDIIVFIEVKYRATDYFGMPREAVNEQKQIKIRNVAMSYIKKKRLYNKTCRFDVIEILGDKITHIEDCF